MALAKGLHGFDGDPIMVVCVGEFWYALHSNEGVRKAYSFYVATSCTHMASAG